MKVLILVLAICMFFCSVANAGINYTATWNPNTEVDIAGYRLYHSSESGAHVIGKGNELFDLPSSTNSVEISVPDEGGYYVLTAYDIKDKESRPSSEVHINPAPKSPELTITITVTIQSQ